MDDATTDGAPAPALEEVTVRPSALTKRQMETIERLVGRRWSLIAELDYDSDLALAAAVRSAVTGLPPDTWDDMPGQDLLASVVIEGGDGEDDDPGNG